MYKKFSLCLNLYVCDSCCRLYKLDKKRKNLNIKIMKVVFLIKIE